MLKDQRVWLLISLYLSGEASLNEQEELRLLLDDDLDLSKQTDVLSQFWKQKNKISKKAEESFDKHLQRLSNHLSEPALQHELREENIYQGEHIDSTKKTIYKLWWSVGIAASVLICWLYFNGLHSFKTTENKIAENTISTKPGSKTNISLPDGSKVWLNADSKITYSGDFQGNTREVYLSGEAYFDIAKDKSRPFIIHTNTIDLKVLGTAFNVRSYANEKVTETALVHGSVEVTLKSSPDKKIILKPSEKLVVKNSEPSEENIMEAVKLEKDADEPIIVLGKMQFTGTDTIGSIETSWTKNRLAFSKEPLYQIASRIERWYDVDVRIKDDRLNNVEYTGSFEDESLKEVLQALQITGDFHFVIKKKEVIITR